MISGSRFFRHSGVCAKIVELFKKVGMKVQQENRCIAAEVVFNRISEQIATNFTRVTGQSVTA